MLHSYRETYQMICNANWLTDFFMIVALAWYDLRYLKNPWERFVLFWI